MLYNYITLIEWFSYGSLWRGVDIAGLSYLNGGNLLASMGWGYATYIRDAIYLMSNTINIYELSSFGLMETRGGLGGFLHLTGNWLGFLTWYIATLRYLYEI